MFPNCFPYQRKSLYLLLSIPLIILYVLVAIFLFQQNITVFIIYLSLFFLTIIIQSYCCEYQSCPYIGKFCPGVGGFLMLASFSALLFKGIKKSKIIFKTFALIGFLCLMTIIILPAFYIFQLGILYLVLYCLIFTAYGMLFLLLICPVCAIRNTCPGGKASGKMKKNSDEGFVAFKKRKNSDIEPKS
jgi:hypothetical protein